MRADVRAVREREKYYVKHKEGLSATLTDRQVEQEIGLETYARRKPYKQRLLETDICYKYRQGKILLDRKRKVYKCHDQIYTCRGKLYIDREKQLKIYMGKTQRFLETGRHAVHRPK